MTDSIMKIDEYGDKRWRNSKGELHRENGPAIIYLNGSMLWRLNGKSHRIDGPAAVFKNGEKIWWLEDREDRCIRIFQHD